MAGGGSTYRRSGRKKGSLNHTTRENLLATEVHKQVAPTPEEAVRQVEDAAVELVGPRRRKLAREHMSDMLEIFVGAAAYYQPKALKGEAADTLENWQQFSQWGKMALDCATALAKYQSPQLRSIQVLPPAPEVSSADKRIRFTLTVFEGGARPQLIAPLDE